MWAKDAIMMKRSIVQQLKNVGIRTIQGVAFGWSNSPGNQDPSLAKYLEISKWLVPQNVLEWQSL
jgi:hypothetical protein